MSQYVRSHRRQIFGIGFPLLFLLFIVVIGIQVYPGWIQPTYSGVGVTCVTEDGDPNNAQLLACDECAGEFCTATSGTMGTCTTGGPILICPGKSPSCFTDCITTAIEGSIGTFTAAPVCAPNDAFCQGITGGTVGNSCRTGTCVGDDDDDVIGTPNPSGCDYDVNSGSQLCINCLPPLEAANCGNGICEKPDEDVSNCSIDCRVPGFTDAEPSPDAGCQLTNITFITYPGPPFNDPFLTPGQCEDGDVCTDNQCRDVIGAAPVCDSMAKTCNNVTADFCCPDGCTPTTDVDCLTPMNCEPTPIPTPTPITFGQVQGSGEAFSCSFNKTWVAPITSAKYFVLLAGILATAFFLKRRFS